MTKNPIFHNKSKHIEINFITFETWCRRELYKSNTFLQIQYVPTKELVADVLTKPLHHVKFEYFRDKLGVVQKDLSRKRE